MVERSRRNTLCRHWRDNSRQREIRHRGGRGLYRSLFGGLATSRRPSRGHISALGAVLGAFALLSAPASATNPVLGTSDYTRHITFQDAMDAYNAGDRGLALAHAKIAANNGDVEAMVMAGHILQRGETGLIDTLGAAEWYRLAAARGNVDAYVGLGELAIREQAGLTASDAKYWLQKAADLGRTDAMRALADMNLQGTGTVPNPSAGTKLLGRAADQGDAHAMKKLGDRLFDTDAEAALGWYEKAAAKGDPNSAYIAAIMYAENYDIRPNAKKAAVLMRQAAEAGMPPAQADYGLLVYQGAGVERDINAAARWFEKAAKAGDREGQFLYAFTLYKGEGVPQSSEDAYYWLLKSDGESGVDDYDTDRENFKKSLEKTLSPSVMARARSRAGK